MRTSAIITLLLLCACSRAPWVPPEPMDTTDTVDIRYGAYLDVLSPESPAEFDPSRWDPQWYRSHEISLSGEWDFAFDPEGDGVEDYDLNITVPFPWQSVLSGIGPEPLSEYPPMETEAFLQTYRGDVWYRRTVTIPESWRPDHEAYLRFGAVDWEARVFLDGVEAAHHVGGYTAFEVPLDTAPGDEMVVEVRVTDPCDDDEAVLVGKQGGMWYTCAGGIWQEVTLSLRPRTHLVSFTDLPAGDGLDVTVRVAGDGDPAQVHMITDCKWTCGGLCEPRFTSAEVVTSTDGERTATLHLPLTDVPAWSPDIPCLVGRAIVLESPDGRDVLHGYTARRAVSIDWVPGHGPEDGVPAEEQYKDLLFEDRTPVHLRAVLDQGYNPDGIWSVPEWGYRYQEMLAIKDMGFNGVRMHIKPEPPWYYAVADWMGLWVVYDMPCAGDLAPSGPGAAWQGHWESAVRALVARDRNRPSILWWVNFNEAWGLLNPPFWGNEEGTGFVEEMYHLVRELDPTRPVEDHSPGGFSEILGALPHVDTDVNSFHAYAADPEDIAAAIASYADGVYPGSMDNVFGGPPQDGAPLIISEMGGQWAGSTWGDAAYPLHAWLNAMRMEPKVRGWVFTQLTDVEWETNGLFTYDRLKKDLGLNELGMELSDLIGDAYLHLGLDPVRHAAPGDPVPLTVSVASMMSLVADNASIELRTMNGQVLDTRTVEGGILAPGVTNLGQVNFDAPLEDGVYVIQGLLVLEDGLNPRQGLYLVVDGGQVSEPGLLAPDTAVIDGEGDCPEGRACRCEGTCAMSFTVAPPAAGTWNLTLLAEVSTFDGPPQQTDPVLASGYVEVYLDGDAAPAETFYVTDARADHRGVLSLGPAWPALRGSYGERIELNLGVHEVGDLLTVTMAAEDTGVQVFFRDGGRYLEATRLVFEAVE